jgi:hypothetical protein
MSNRHKHGGGSCGLPFGFQRLRYFTGKEMRLADYVDEQNYHSGKMKLHNQRLHGAGLLCGLKLSCAAGSFLLRVSRGAAVDACGREIIVGFDQCIDVAQWFEAQRRDQDRRAQPGSDPCKPDAKGRVHVCVAIRYAECSNSPERASATTCSSPGCGGGCSCGGPACPGPCGDSAEFGRVSEEFELRLMFRDEAEHAAGLAPRPASKGFDGEPAGAASVDDIMSRLFEAAREQCSDGECNWLLLGCFALVLNRKDDDRLLELADIDHGCSSPVLLPTLTLQALLAGILSEVDISPGAPRVTSVKFRRFKGDFYQFILVLNREIDAASVDADDNFDLRELTPTGWDGAGANATSIKYRAKGEGEEFMVGGPAIYIEFNNRSGFLKPDGRYQLYANTRKAPVVDEFLRPLRLPTHAFGIKREANGDLAMTHLTPADI